MKRIESNEYFDAVSAYFADNKEPDRVYRFLLGTLREDHYKLADDLLYRSVDTLETTENCFRFCTGSECILVLCSEPRK
jgi:predicted transcriptional regulator